MDRENKSRKLKRAWIDEGQRIVSFTILPNSASFLAEEPAFWKKITLLMNSGYRIQ